MLTGVLEALGEAFGCREAESSAQASSNPLDLLSLGLRASRHFVQEDFVRPPEAGAGQRAFSAAR